MGKKTKPDFEIELMKKILFITTNPIWGGSEELWTRTLDALHERGYQMIFSAPYNNSRLDKLSGSRIPYFNLFRKSFIMRLRERIVGRRPDCSDILKKQLLRDNPSIVIISQGDNVASVGIMNTCATLGIPYSTISQLVAELHFLFINDNNLHSLRDGYLKAVRNYFVSRHNLKLNNKMIGLQLSNSEVIYNPCKVKNSCPPVYVVNSLFRIAMVGRIECYHKGYDLLFEVVEAEKWRNRPVQFDIYGDGPHRRLLEMLIAKKGIRNVSFNDFISDVTEIWKVNHILLMTSRIEGQSLSLIEAMWSQRAAIVTDVGGATELIEEGVNGFVADAPTLKSIDSALERAWQSRYSWKELGLKAAETIKSKHPADETKFLADKIVDDIR